MRILCVVALFVCYSAFCGEAKPAAPEKPVEKAYELADITLPNWTPPKTKGKGIAVFVTPPTLDNLSDLITRRVHPESWDAALDTKITEQPPTKLLIRQTPTMHEKVAAFLTAIRQAAASPIGTVTPIRGVPPAKAPREWETRLYTSSLNGFQVDSERLRAVIPHADWDSPASSVENLTAKTNSVVVIYQTKEVHDLIRANFAKLQKPGR